MARTTGAYGMLDLRSISLVYDFHYPVPLREKTPPGQVLLPSFRKDTVGSDYEDNFDSKRSWFLLCCACALQALTNGVFNSTVLFQPFIAERHELELHWILLISGGAYAVFLIFSPLSYYIIRSWGPRFSAKFGLLLGFLGLTLMAMHLNVIIYLVAFTLLFGTGCAIVQNAVCCSIADFFKNNLFVALICFSISSPIGTMIFLGLSYFLGIEVFKGILEIQWMMVIYGVLFLVAIGLTWLLPKTIFTPGHRDYLKTSHVAERVKRCILNPNSGIPSRFTGGGELKPPTRRTEHGFTYVYVTDCGVCCDLSFYLWAAICFCAMLTFYIPFICLAIYTKIEFGFGYGTAVRLAVIYCGISVLTRIIVMFVNPFTFLSTRSILQIGLVVNACIYFAMTKADTFGWLVVVCLVLGCTDGVIVIIIPQMTLLIFPRNNLHWIWILIITVKAMSVMCGVAFFVLARQEYAGNIMFPCVVIGVFQIIAALLATVLPQNKESKNLEAQSAKERKENVCEVNV